MQFMWIGINLAFRLYVEQISVARAQQEIDGWKVGNAIRAILFTLLLLAIWKTSVAHESFFCGMRRYSLEHEIENWRNFVEIPLTITLTNKHSNTCENRQY